MKPEEKVSRAVQNLIAVVGGMVWNTEQGYRKERGGSRCTPGLPDMLVFVGGHFTFVELKAGRNKPNPAQLRFRDECWRAGISWQLWYSVFDCKSWLTEIGVVEDDRGPEAA